MPNLDPEASSNPPSANATTPLLPSDRRHLDNIRTTRDWFDHHIVTIHGEETYVWKIRHGLQDFLSSKWGHYFVLVLVSLDILGIFATFLISLHICEHGGEKGFNLKAWSRAVEVLGNVSLMFSCLFMAELIGSVFAFGFGYFKSPFHIFDAAVIVAAFIVDILEKGPLEEAGSLVVVLRLWRIFKIIEEFSTGANDQMEGLYEHIDRLKEENESVRRESDSIKAEIDNLRRRTQMNGTNHPDMSI